MYLRILVSRLISKNLRAQKAVRRIRCRLHQVYHGVTVPQADAYISLSAVVHPCLIAKKYCYIGPRCLIGPAVEIGRYTLLAPNVTITANDHEYTIPGVPIYFSGRPTIKSTKIGSDVWIGSNSVVIGGVTIGNGSIIAAGSIVVADVPENVIFGGVPARHINERFSEEDWEIHKTMLEGITVDGDFPRPT